MENEITKGTVNSETEFVHGRLIQIKYATISILMEQIHACSIVVMDNCSIHHVQPVLDAFNQAGIVVLFLPPYQWRIQGGKGGAFAPPLW